MTPDRRYYDLNTYFRSAFGCRVHKITLDAGFSCPNRDGTISTGGCIYCNERGSGTGAHARGLSVTEQLAAGKEAMARRFKAQKFIAYFQAYTNTYGPVDHLKRLYDEALAVPDVAGLSIGTRPDCLNDAVLDLLASYAQTHMVWLEIGVQSASDRTLAIINRGHDTACTTRAVHAARARGIAVCGHIILGLPGETRQDMLRTGRYIADLGMEGVKFHSLYVVRGTALEIMMNSGGYRCLEQREYVELVCDVLEVLPPAMVIQRLTGDPHADELAAPAWTLDKRGTLDAIRDTLKRRDSWQGKFYQTSGGSV
ncbi:MAG: TIGR01212 family radical SAM protein [Thermodesulfobacteriota bacterium]